MKELEALLKKHKQVVIDFTATWCGPCRRFAPFVIEQETKYPHIFFIKIDVDTNQNICQALQVDSMPTFFFYKSGNLITTSSFSGANSELFLQGIKGL